VLTLFSGLQVWAFIQSERAFVGLDIVQITGGLIAQKPIVLSIRMKNSGKSTAFIEDLIINSRFEKATAHLPETPAYVPGNPITPGPVLSNGVITVRAMPDGMHGEPQMLFNETDIVAIKSGTFKFYIFGYISFTDEFTLLRAKRTGFCALYNPEIANQFDACPERAYTYAH
jgi:hypothetical protein